jgi:hypothetical protein
MNNSFFIIKLHKPWIGIPLQIYSILFIINNPRGNDVLAFSVIFANASEAIRFGVVYGLASLLATMTVFCFARRNVLVYGFIFSIIVQASSKPRLTTIVSSIPS